MPQCSGISACTDLDETTYGVIAAEDYEFTDADRAAMFYPVYNSLRVTLYGDGSDLPTSPTWHPTSGVCLIA